MRWLNQIHAPGETSSQGDYMTKRTVKSDEICETSKYGESASNKCKCSQMAPKHRRKIQLELKSPSRVKSNDICKNLNHGKSAARYVWNMG